VVLLAVVLLGPSLARAQTVDDVYPLEPADGAIVGPKPFLKIGVEGSDLPKMRFRIELSRDDFDTIAYTFDQQEERNGWAFTALGSESGAMYRVSRPLSNGKYDWRAAAWNGVDWVPGDTVFRLYVDSVPPADVDGLEIRWDPDSGSVHLEWDPVVTDRDGRPETVAKYNVYRYERRSIFFVSRIWWVGETEVPEFDDRSLKGRMAPLLFYKVSAQDAAGNEFDRRY